MTRRLAVPHLDATQELILIRLLGKELTNQIDACYQGYRVGERIHTKSLEAFKQPAERVLKASNELYEALLQLERGVLWAPPQSLSVARNAIDEVRNDLTSRLHRPPNREPNWHRQLFAIEVARTLEYFGYPAKKTGRPGPGSVARVRLEQGLPVANEAGEKPGWILAEVLAVTLRVKKPQRYVELAVNERRKPNSEENQPHHNELPPVVKATFDCKRKP